MVWNIHVSPILRDSFSVENMPFVSYRVNKFQFYSSKRWKPKKLNGVNSRRVLKDGHFQSWNQKLLFDWKFDSWATINVWKKRKILRHKISNQTSWQKKSKSEFWYPQKFWAEFRHRSVFFVVTTHSYVSQMMSKTSYPVILRKTWKEKHVIISSWILEVLSYKDLDKKNCTHKFSIPSKIQIWQFSIEHARSRVFYFNGRIHFPLTYLDIGWKIYCMSKWTVIVLSRMLCGIHMYSLYCMFDSCFWIPWCLVIYMT